MANYAGSMFHYPDTSLNANSNEFGTTNAPGVNQAGNAAAFGANGLVAAFTSRNVNYNEGFAKRKVVLVGSGLVEATIPLNRYGFFESFRDQLCPPGRVSLDVTIDSDNDAIYAGAANTGRLIITKMVLWIARLTFNPLGMKTFMGGLTEPKEWTYLSDSVSSTLARRDSSASWVVNASVERPQHVFIWFIDSDRINTSEHNQFTPNIFNIANGRTVVSCRLEVGSGVFYPNEDLNPTDDMARAYRMLMDYTAANNDYLSGPTITPELFENVYGLLYFDLRKQMVEARDATQRLAFKYTIKYMS